jgi:hypothetical protein
MIDKKKGLNMKKIFIILGIVIFSTATVAKQSYEVGIGSSYGGLGVSVNSELNSNTELFTGVGLDLDSVGYVVGAKFWLNDNARLTTSYGTNCVVYSGGYYHAYEGLNLGIGYSFTGKEEGWIFELLLADVSDCVGFGSDSAIDIGVGYRF